MSSPRDETSLAETGLQAGSGAQASHPSAGSASRPGWLSSSGPGPSGESVAPGALLAERYRVLGLVGRGGMGEVYRAEDLRLGQTVALKFLPAAVAEDPQRLAQFHHEVRIARQVSHRNVCRVYDIGEDHGRVFLTMELIDGEDLAGLLKRVGRFPEERATEIARQICAGLAAAHDCGVLHRDLKPANIMLDADGRVRIADFGLAGLAGTFTDVRSGTPAYMAPEQLAGKDVTERSDIFALGLVLFEIYTGRRAFDATTIAELLRQHDDGIRLSSAPSGPSLDPVVEQVILRCLAPNPAMRPASAIAVSAALPGGDPLAAALAAGETPSPAMVAAAGRVEPVPLAIGLSLLAFVVVCLGGFIALRSAVSFHRHVPLPLSSAVLEDRARQVLDRFGYRDVPADSVGEVYTDDDYLRWARKQPQAGRWAQLSSGRVPVIGFWYRTSPRLLIPQSENRFPSLTDPPLRLVGMTETLVDSSGALVEFHAVPPQHTPGQPVPNQLVPNQPAASQPAAAIDWQVVFDAAHWPRDRFTPATPEWTPLVDTDTRAAWTGTLPELGATPLRLEAGSFGGRLVFVQTVGPWTKPSREAPPESKSIGQRVPDLFLAVLILSLILGSVLLARRNMVLGRGDQQGGWRVAAALAALNVARWAFAAHHVPDYPVEQDAILDAIGRALLPAGIVWLAYLGIEPWIRRHWPTSLISWSRLLAGAVRDPLVGRDMLIGLAFGVGTALIPTVSQQVLLSMAGGVPAPDFSGVWALSTPRYAVSLVVGGVSNALFNSLLLMVLYVVLRRLLRRPWLAAVLVMALLALVIGAEEGLDGSRIALAVIVLMAVLILLPLVRFGLLPFAVSFFSRQILVGSPLTADLGAWYATATWIIGATVIGLAILAFKHSRAGAPTFGRLLEEIVTQRYVLALDQGTTSSRAMLFGRDGRVVSVAQREFPQIFPKPGEVEHDPEAIWTSQLETARDAISQAGITASDVAAIGVTNQRETTVLWDKQTGVPVAPAIVWQSRVSAPICDRLKAAGHEALIRRKTGLVIDAYFSGTKVTHLLETVPGLRARAERGDILFGTIDTFLIWRLTGGRRHVTDVTNASRTLMFDIHALDWDDELLRILGVPRRMLPAVHASSEVYGETDASHFGIPIPIAGIAGDQQAALFGQACFTPGMAKNTYGTGCFLLMNTGSTPTPSAGGLLTTIAWKVGGEVTYALEGAVFIAGAAVQWMRDGLRAIVTSADIERLATSVPDAGGVYLVPAFVGLGAPHWDPYARGIIIGLTRDTTVGHIARATVDAMAYQSRDVLSLMEKDAGVKLAALRVDGGASVNNALLQFQANLLDVTVRRPVVAETTALGAAYLAGLAVGYWRDLDDIAGNWALDREFTPQMEPDRRKALTRGWDRAVERSLHWIEPA